MYLQHFGLREQPFSLTPDTSFFFASPSYQEALNTLLVAAHNGEGFIKITGEVGVGKTLLCRKFLAALNQGQCAIKQAGVPTDAQATPRFITACIPNPYLEPRSLLLALAVEFRLPQEQDTDPHLLLKGLTRALLECARKGQRALVCMDEAQAMSLENLEVLRLLTNLETEKRKLLQVVLFGQQELNKRLRHHSIRQLRQRISFQYDLQGLHRDELEHYLSHRLAVAGYTGGSLFGKNAVGKLYRVTGGIPRLVNLVAHKALMLAFSEDCRQVQVKHIRDAAADTPEARHDWLPWVAALAGIAAITFIVIAWLRVQ